MAKAKKKAVKRSAETKRAARSPRKRRAAKPSFPSTKRREHPAHGANRRDLHRNSGRGKPVVIDERNPAAVKLYESALRSFHHQDFVRARDCFQKVIEQFSKEAEIVERARVHLKACLQKLSRNSAPLKTADDFYNLAIAHLNRRELGEAEVAFQKALSLEPKGDHILYGLATLECLRGQAVVALKYLQRAIQLNPANRATAGHDPDFELLAESPEFKTLVHPPQPR